MTCGCLIAARNGHDFPRLIDERVPSVAAVIDDVVEGFENSVREPVLPHEFPDIFLAVEFGRAWRDELASGLVAKPEPCKLDHGRPCTRVPSPANAPIAVHTAALVGHRGDAHVARDLTTIVE